MTPAPARSIVPTVVFERAKPAGSVGANRQSQSLTLGLLALAIAAAAAAVLEPGLLCLVPALALPFLLLALDRYPGERILLKASAVPRRPRPSRTRTRKPAVRALPVPRGGLLMARSLANRPPPNTSLAAA